MLTLYVKAEISYDVVMSRKYLDMAEAFDNSEYSKHMTWHEFSSKSGYSGDIWQANYDDSQAQSNDNAIKRIEKEKIIVQFMDAMLKEYDLFVGENYEFHGKKKYVEGLVKNIKCDVHFYQR